MQMAGSPELIERVERLTLELAERIAIESYDVGEHLFEIMDDMHPVLRASTYRGVVVLVVLVGVVGLVGDWCWLVIGGVDWKCW